MHLGDPENTPGSAPNAPEQEQAAGQEKQPANNDDGNAGVPTASEESQSGGDANVGAGAADQSSEAGASQKDSD